MSPKYPAGKAVQSYPSLEGKAFLICVGAMKAATSWIHHYLAAMPDVAATPLKELHFFNARFPDRALGDMEALALSRLEFHLARDGNAAANLRDSATFRASVDRAQMIYDDSAYFGHFARICGPETRAFCDITPAYAVIGAPGFAYVRDFCAAQGIAPKILFVMRDPVARFWSQLRHMQQINPENDALTRWPRAILSDPMMARADYRGTIEALDATFAPEDILYLFYETLFTAPALTQLCRFIGVPFRPGDGTVVHNRTGIDIALPKDAHAAFLSHLAPQYDFCRARFGDRIPDGWAG